VLTISRRSETAQEALIRSNQEDSMATDETITTGNETIIDREIETEEEEVGLVYDENSLNLVNDFYQSEEGKKELQKIAKDIYDKYEQALSLSKEYRDRYTKDYGLFLCHMEEKNFPWPDCANVNVPITLEGVMRLWARFYGEVFQDWNRVVAFEPMGEDDKPIQDLLTVHTNWQVRTEITDFRRQMCRAIYLFIWGDVSCHSYRDPVTDRNRHEILTCDELIRPYTFASVEPDYSDLPWIAKRLKREKYQLERMEEEYHKETLSKVLKKQPAYGDQTEGQELHDKAEKIQGERKPYEEKAPYDLIHWEGWLDLPQQVRQRFCQLHMDLSSQRILKMTIHEEPDWKEKERFERQTMQLQDYQKRQMMYENQMAMFEEQQQMMPMGPPPIQGAPPLMMPPQPPIPPTWMQEGMTEPAPAKKSPIRMFRHAVCIEPLVGNLGIGLARILADLNKTANTLANQFVDSATAANIPGWLRTGGLEFPEGELTLGPGRMNVVNIAGGKLGDHIHEFRPSAANPQMYQMFNLVAEWAQSAGQTPDILSGQAGKSGETWRGVATRVEQAMKQLSAISQGLAEFVEGVYDNNAKLNAKFMPEDDFFYLRDDILTPSGQLMGGKQRITRADYTRKTKYRLTADMKFTSQAQRIAEADELVMNIMQLAGAGPMMLPLLWPMLAKALKDAFEARGKYSYMPLIPNQVPMPAQPPKVGGASGAAGAAPTGQAA
jgi:hypothetical protein